MESDKITLEFHFEKYNLLKFVLEEAFLESVAYKTLRALTQDRPKFDALYKELEPYSKELLRTDLEPNEYQRLINDVKAIVSQHLIVES